MVRVDEMRGDLVHAGRVKGLGRAEVLELLQHPPGVRESPIALYLADRCSTVSVIVAAEATSLRQRPAKGTLPAIDEPTFDLIAAGHRPTSVCRRPQVARHGSTP